METSKSTSGVERGLAAIILAAGRSTRMKTDQPKVMHNLCGQPMLSHVLAACREAGIQECYVVVGFGKDLIIKTYDQMPGIHFVEQPEQKGSGHAVSMCSETLKGFTGDVVVIAGDMPMIRSETLKTLTHSHRAAGATASIATTILDDPTGYGRIVRDANDNFERIVEHRDCSAEQLKIREVNPSYYCFDAQALFEALPKIKPDNAKGEYYITDALEIIRDLGKTVRAATSVPAVDAVGINSRSDLAEVAKLMQKRIQSRWMDEGVSLVDPDTTWIDSRAQIGPDTLIKPFSYIEGSARVGRNCTIGPYAYLADGAVVEDDSTVGPGVLNAFDATKNPRNHSNPTSKRAAPVVRQPPATTGCAQGGGSC
ncbi:MAG: NTP transferase domain-containing protein [Phycisphaerales bacterium]|nr:NTP transferase domain-containing protein [Phycisphaerales bacterium]